MDSQPLAVVVLAAGLGKRMASQQPKVLHRLAGLPLAAHVLRSLAPLAPTRTVLVVGHGAEQVQSTLGTTYGPNNSIAIEYVYQAEQLGTGHAVHMAKAALQDFHGPVLVVYGDSPLLKTATLSALIARQRQARAHLTVLTCIAADPSGYGRVVRDSSQRLVEVVEEKNATLVQRAISEVNSGVYVFDSDWLWPHLERVELNPQGEYYLTDLIGMAIQEERLLPAQSGAGRASQSGVITFTQEGLDETMGINSRAQLAQAEQIVQERLRHNLLESGVTMLLPETVYLGMDVTIGPDTTLYPGVILQGKTSIAGGCTLGPNTHIIDSTIGEGCRVISSMIEGSTIDHNVTIGPFSHLRPGTHLGKNVHIGNFVEIKASTLESGVHSGHFSYLGDASIGEDTNIGAGTITANFDSATHSKNRTTIGKNAFIGVDTMLVAPREVGEGAITGAGSVVTKDVPPYTLAVGVPARVIRHLTKKPDSTQTDETGSEAATAREESEEE
ncbi:MAG: bifunctional UDP-N-acetylglucosamine diphosphorylase/glucosamine-1-phosphate N-acetyltransferase GlmU [Chloroflexota bacterium]